MTGPDPARTALLAVGGVLVASVGIALVVWGAAV